MSRLTVPAHSKAIFHWGGWTLYELRPREDQSPLWPSFKLMLPPETPSKWGEPRQFLLNWNVLELRLRKDSYRVELALKYPELYLRVELFLSLNYSSEWLVTNQGMIEAEIAAEQAKLVASARERRARKRAA